jgi:hypothetical protein
MYGNIHYYRNEGDSANYNFVWVTDNYMDIDVGDYSAPYFCNIDNDGDYDLFVGEGGDPPGTTPSLGLGDVNFYENIGDSVNANFVQRQQNLLSLDIGRDSYPSFVDIDNDGDMDLFVGEEMGNLNFFRNIGTINNPSFVLETEFFQSQFYGWQSQATFGDLDADVDKDMIIGCGIAFTSLVKVYINQGTPEIPDLILQNANLLGNIGLADPYLIDIDNDNDLDLFIGEFYETGDGRLRFYRNIGDPSHYNFVLENDNMLGDHPGWALKPCLIDIDNDLDYDLFASGLNTIEFYRNIGTPEVFNFVLEADTFLNISNQPGQIFATFCDIDNDGYADIFYGEIDGGLKYYHNISDSVYVNIKPTSNPTEFLLRDCSPNPFNATTTIEYDLPWNSKVRLTMFNISGQKVATLYDGIQASGYKKIEWNGTSDSGLSLASGVYILRMEAASLADGKYFKDSSKLLLLK